MFSRESKLELAKLEAKLEANEALAKQVKVSLKFEIEEVGVISFLDLQGGAKAFSYIIPKCVYNVHGILDCILRSCK